MGELSKSISITMKKLKSKEWVPIIYRNMYNTQKNATNYTALEKYFWCLPVLHQQFYNELQCTSLYFFAITGLVWVYGV